MTAVDAETSAAIGPVQQAIFQRRSIRRFADRPVDRSVLERILDAAVQAPNHRITRPWRFFVLDGPGDARAELTRLAEEGALRAMPGVPDERAREGARRKAQEVARVPVLVLSFSTPGRDEAETRENYAACACAMQNLMLAATEEGLVSGWSTGGITRDPSLRAVIGADESWELVGALYMGYPEGGAEAPQPTPRPGAAASTTWLSDS
jgi:nitroreductase